MRGVRPARASRLVNEFVAYVNGKNRIRDIVAMNVSCQKIESGVREPVNTLGRAHQYGKHRSLKGRAGRS